MFSVYYVPQTHHTATFFPDKETPKISVTRLEFWPINCPGVILKITLLHSTGST